MPNSISFIDNVALHSNFAYVVYDGNIIGRLDNVKFIIDKDVEYDVIIGSGGKPFGQPVIKFTKFSGNFTKGMIKIGDIDDILMLDAVGNDHADIGGSHNEKDFVTNELTKFSDTDGKSISLFPSTYQSHSISFGGVVLKTYTVEIVNNKFIQITGEFIGKFLEYYRVLKPDDFTNG